MDAPDRRPAGELLSIESDRDCDFVLRSAALILQWTPTPVATFTRQEEERTVLKRSAAFALASALLVVGVVLAQQPQPAQPHPQPQAQQQPQSKYPMLDQVAAKVIQKYQTSSCVQLATEKSQPATGQKAAMEARAIELLKNDAELRKAFLAKVAAPIADKLLQCGMIP
jgi:hypothetical protein